MSNALTLTLTLIPQVALPPAAYLLLMRAQGMEPGGAVSQAWGDVGRLVKGAQEVASWGKLVLHGVSWCRACGNVVWVEPARLQMQPGDGGGSDGGRGCYAEHDLIKFMTKQRKHTGNESAHVQHSRWW